MPTEFTIPDFKTQTKLLAERKAHAKSMADQANQSIQSNSQGRMVGPYWIAYDDRGDHLKAATAAGLGFFADREEQTQGQQLQDIRAELLRRMPSETRTLPAIPAGNNPDEVGEQVPMREVINRNFDTEARQWGIQAGQVPGMEGMASSMFAESVKAPGRRMEKQEAREARQAELDAARIARQQEAQANREWREAEANRARDDREAARQLNAEDRAAQAREARADRAANAAAIRAEKAAQPKPLTPKQLETQRGFTDLEKSLNHYEGLLANYDPQSRNAITPTNRAALESAFTDLQMKLKTLYELGAPQAGDLKLLEQSLANPVSLKGTLAGAAFGKEPILAKTREIRTLLDNSRDSFDSQFNVTSPRIVRNMAHLQQSGQAAVGRVGAKTVVREVKLKDGRTGVEYSDGTRGYK